jgi:hypothetical protein
LNSNITFGEGNYVFDGSPAIEAVTPPAYQTLTWTTIPSTSLTTGGSYTPSATSSSGLPVTITLDSASSGCTLIAGVVKLTGTTGTCLVDANQEAVGSTSFYPAAQIQQVVPVPKSSSAPQVVSFSTTQPSPATIGSTYNVIAATTLTSSIPTVTSETPSVCTVASSGTVVVAFKTAGECVIDANDGASGSTLRAPEAQQAIVVSPGNGLPTTIIGNNVLFYVRPTGGSIDFGDNSAVELTPLSSGVAIWDAAASSVTINNVADNRNTFGGIYIPGGSVNATTTSNSGTMSVMFIVASTMTMAPVVTLNVTGP